MDVELVHKRFADLAHSEHRSQMVRFREVFESVDAAIRAGVTVKDARNELASLGLDIKLTSFKTMLMRLRGRTEWQLRRRTGVPCQGCSTDRLINGKIR